MDAHPSTFILYLHTFYVSDTIQVVNVFTHHATINTHIAPYKLENTCPHVHTSGFKPFIANVIKYHFDFRGASVIGN